MITRRLALVAVARSPLRHAGAHAGGPKLRFGVGPLQPTPTETKKAYEPFFAYSDGATHAANEISVASGQVDCATDFDRNRNTMIESGRLDKDATEVVWQSDPLPNDAIAVPRDFDPALASRIQKILVEITDAQARTMLPTRYTGFVAADHGSYKMIEDAGISVGRIKKK